jgi:hypothetical protein
MEQDDRLLIGDCGEAKAGSGESRIYSTSVK